MKRILVGYDGSDAAGRALDRAIEEARDDRATVTVLTVLELPLDPQVPRYFGTLNDIADWEGQPIEPPPGVIEVLAAARDKLEAAGVDAEFTWAAGEPGRAIVDGARDLRADLVVLGEHHHGFLSGLVGSDVAAEVRAELGCDVVVV